MLIAQNAGFAPDYVDYATGLARQQELHDAVRDGRSPATALYLEHAAVYTAGVRTLPEERPDDGSPVVDVPRGGKITWHGPGQLVGYPIVRLARPRDVVGYVRTLETALVEAVRDRGIEAQTITGRTGVWVPGQAGAPDRKIAAIGIRVEGGTTMHGFALNCSNSLDPFAHIVPCGISDAATTTISAETGETVHPAALWEDIHARLANLDEAVA